MKIRFWPHTQHPSVASFRIRCLEVSRGLSLERIDSQVVSTPETSDILILSKRYDADSLEKALKLRARTGSKIVLDICDNHFHDRITNDYINKRHRDLKEALQAVDLVIASSEYLASELVKEMSSIANLVVIDDIIEPPFFPSWKQKVQCPFSEVLLKNLEFSLEKISSDRQTRLVWFGNAGGGFVDAGMENLNLVREYIDNASSSRPVSLTVISNSRRIFKDVCGKWGGATYYLPWSKHTISRALMLHGISIIPIARNPFTLAKTANRLTTSLVHGLAVVADSIPSYCAYSHLACLDDWEASLNRLTQNRELWQRASDYGKTALNIQRHNQEVIKRWAKILATL